VDQLLPACELGVRIVVNKCGEGKKINEAGKDNYYPAGDHVRGRGQRNPFYKGR
jgi:hypothetical protein